MKKVINFEKLGHLVVVDRNDYDIVYFLHREPKPLEYYKEYIEKNYEDYAKDISVTIYEVWQPDTNEFQFDQCGIFLDDSFPIVEKEFDIPLNFYLKNIKDEKIEMKKTEFNEVEYLMEEWDEWNEHLFNYNGANWLVSKQSLERLKELIDKLEKFAD